MSLPPALLQRLAQRGLVQKTKEKKKKAKATKAAAESEEVIAEDYDEMESEDHRAAARAEYQHPPLYDKDTSVKRVEENFWLERMKERMGEANSTTGHRGCPNKYNIWHKCTLFCVNRWGDGKTEPSREYMRRYKRLRRKYPLPKGWSDRYDPGCGSYYFVSIAENLVSWLPPTHPKSQVTKSAAVFRRQLEEAAGGEGAGGSDGEQHDENTHDAQETELARHQREIDEIINSSMRPRSPAPPTDFPSIHEIAQLNAVAPQRKQKSRDLDRTLAKQRRERGDKEREREQSSGGRRHGGKRGGDVEKADPMDPSSYSDIPRGKWSDGLATSGGDESRKAKKANGPAKESGRERDKRADVRRDSED
ncbi:polyglutamine-binding protein 1 [Eurosta solidaginis]|uniref:polyglutamine-binding protein 1 n=1 Tax=Eurosta solidaginis TaxID=178769 RepID=UPI00353131E4